MSYVLHAVCAKLPAMATQDRPARRTQEYAAIGQAMKLVMDEKGLSQADLARRTKIDYRAISKHLKGQGNPTYETLKELCDGLGISLGELLLRAEDLAQQNAGEAAD
jgi:transcriptional regulator with XRE-family HTH domain